MGTVTAENCQSENCIMHVRVVASIIMVKCFLVMIREHLFHVERRTRVISLVHPDVILIQTLDREKSLQE